MAIKKSKKAAAPAKAEAAAPKGTMSKADAVRAALAKGIVAPTDAVRYIKLNFGIEMPKQQFSVYKSEMKKRGEKAAATTPAKTSAPPSHYLAPPPKPAAAAGSEPDVLLAVATIKPLIERYGAAKVRRIVELLG